MSPFVLFKCNIPNTLVVPHNKMHIKSSMRISDTSGVLIEESRHTLIVWVFVICRWYAQFFPAIKRLVIATKSTSSSVIDQKIRANVPILYIRGRNRASCLYDWTRWAFNDPQTHIFFRPIWCTPASFLQSTLRFSC